MYLGTMHGGSESYGSLDNSGDARLRHGDVKSHDSTLGVPDEVHLLSGLIMNLLDKSSNLLGG